MYFYQILSSRFCKWSALLYMDLISFSIVHFDKKNFTVFTQPMGSAFLNTKTQLIIGSRDYKAKMHVM